MLLTLTTTHSPATDLGFVLRKNPDRVHAFALAFGQAHVVWPEAGQARATAALLVELDPVALVRGRRDSPSGGPLALYVNDRPYVASSFMSVAIAKVFRSALNGSAPERPELATTPIPLEIEVHVVASRGGPALLGRLFEPLGYTVASERLARDETRPEWGDSALYRLRLANTVTVQAALQHLYVLLPVLDDDKHYWVGRDEVDKLVARGGEWLPDHPEKGLITHRYLKHFGGLAREALARLDVAEGDDPPPHESGRREDALEKPMKLNDVRMGAVVEVLRTSGARRVVDLGCGEGKLLRKLLGEPQFTEVVGVDVSARALDVAHRRLDTSRTPLGWVERLKLLNGSATYRDPRLDGYDAVACVEVVEHIDAERLDAFAASLFGATRPALVVITTPNAEYNARFELDGFRHPDHRFEWTRAEFRAWAEQVARAHGYTVSIEPIGPVDEALGAPTQMGVFRCR